MNCIVYGEVLWDVYPDKSVIGGAPFNFAAHLSLDDDSGNLFTLDFLAASEEHAKLLCNRFRTNPEQVYNGILNALLSDPNKPSNRKED